MSISDINRTNHEIWDDVFDSDIIDLSDLDLTAIRALPNAVLRDAVERVCAELGDDAGTTAFFQSSMQGARPVSQAAENNRNST